MALRAFSVISSQLSTPAPLTTENGQPRTRAKRALDGASRVLGYQFSVIHTRPADNGQRRTRAKRALDGASRVLGYQFSVIHTRPADNGERTTENAREARIRWRFARSRLSVLSYPHP